MKLNYKGKCGNALFLILIAVALFATLSFVVTNSTRSGSNTIEKENVGLELSIILNQLTYLRTNIARLQIETGRNDLGLTTNAGDIYDPENGLIIQHPPAEIMHETGTLNVFTWYLDESRIILNGNDLGTSANDLSLYLGALDDDICEAINKKFHNTDTRPTMGFSVTTPPARETAVRRNGTIRSGTFNRAIAIGYDKSNICGIFSGQNFAFFTVYEK